MKTKTFEAALRAINAGGLLKEISPAIYHHGGVYRHCVLSANKRYHIREDVVKKLEEHMALTKRNTLHCAARGCEGCTVCQVTK